jgi:hypothetical protein
MHVRGRTDKDSCWCDSGLAGIALSWAALPLICAMYVQAQSKPTGMESMMAGYERVGFVEAGKAM